MENDAEKGDGNICFFGVHVRAAQTTDHGVYCIVCSCRVVATASSAQHTDVENPFCKQHVVWVCVCNQSSRVDNNEWHTCTATTAYSRDTQKIKLHKQNEWSGARTIIAQMYTILYVQFSLFHPPKAKMKAKLK